MININGMEWRILLVSPFHFGLRRSDGTYSLGCCDNELKTIYINNEVNNFYFKKILCHELTHAAFFSYEVELSWEQEELIADLISTYG